MVVPLPVSLGSVFFAVFWKKEQSERKKGFVRGLFCIFSRPPWTKVLPPVCSPWWTPCPTTTAGCPEAQTRSRLRRRAATGTCRTSRTRWGKHKCMGFWGTWWSCNGPKRLRSSFLSPEFNGLIALLSFSFVKFLTFPFKCLRWVELQVCAWLKN